ncbi:unnamed protein product [Prorocentrum cordatum]|uniref:Uncharacterized protein n=1 Tax=Prorocentrum cordatum TaxID=2364126 RepID=A0ABN9SVB4_9DINO|nr:unnamed protein product [Polarella glacialis]
MEYVHTERAVSVWTCSVWIWPVLRAGPAALPAGGRHPSQGPRSGPERPRGHGAQPWRRGTQDAAHDALREPPGDVPPESFIRGSDQAAPALSEEMALESVRVALAKLNSSEGAAALGSGMIPGISAESAMFKATDLLFGVTGIVLEDPDYPYACLCDAEGACQEPRRRHGDELQGPTGR